MIGPDKSAGVRDGVVAPAPVRAAIRDRLMWDSSSWRYGSGCTALRCVSVPSVHPTYLGCVGYSRQYLPLSHGCHTTTSLQLAAFAAIHSPEKKFLDGV